MSTTSRLVGALLVTSALTVPSIVHAQNDPDTDAAAAVDAPADQADQADQGVEISVPGGGEIVVTGARRPRDPTRSSSQVLSVLSTEQIAKTGEGNIAGSLTRVTGLSVVGSGYVYVRGLGDRYSLALLNGSPLPSPEPLKRVVPLDIFPTGVIASALVQKSYSANFPGEFGGGVINLTTKATPNEPFLSIGASVSGDTFTTFQNGLTYYGGGRSDWFGYDDGSRAPSALLQAYFANGKLAGGDLSAADNVAIAGSIVTGNNALVQRIPKVAANFALNVSAGKTWDVGENQLGVIFAVGYSNKWLTRQTHQQTSSSFDLTSVETDFTRVITDQRIVVNGLLGLGYEFGDNTIRWTNLYIHDAIKQARSALGQRPAQNSTNDYLQQSTALYERQLIDSQLVVELRPSTAWSIDLRGGYANSKRKAPGQLDFEYVRTNAPSDPFGANFVNLLNGNQGNAQVTYQDLNEDLWSGGIDVTYRPLDVLSLTAGGAYSDQSRTSSRRQLLFRAPSSFQGFPVVIQAIGVLRPDVLLSNDVVSNFGIQIVENDPGVPAFAASLKTWAGYLKGNWQIAEAVSIDAGVRYEKADEVVTPIKVFNLFQGTGTTSLSRSYWLPAATLTWEIQPDLQFRLSGSKTIARPQFRELINQPYYDPDSNRAYRGNPLLVDSQLYNAEARLEWYFDRDQKVSVAAFYKKIDHPIESYVFGQDSTTSYANAPTAKLYGAEIEVQKYFDLSGWGGFWENRRFVVVGNYTYTKSRIDVSATDTTQIFTVGGTALARDYFQDGSPLTGQSDHLVNLQLGLENQDKLSQQTILLNYASERAVSRGLTGTPPQPDVIEKPGFTIDFVAREGIRLFGADLELKAEARNITGRKHQEYQLFGTNRIDINTYDVGTSFSLGVTAKF